VAFHNKDKKIRDLKKNIDDADLELKELEKIYLAKMAKLLLYSHIVNFKITNKILAFSNWICD